MTINGPMIAKPKKPRGQPKPKSSSVSPVPVALEFHFRDHDMEHKRVWRPDWASDAFEVIDNQSFNRFRVMLKRFSVPMVDKNGDD